MGPRGAGGQSDPGVENQPPLSDRRRRRSCRIAAARSATLGAAKSRIDLQKTFTTSLMDSIERGVGQLVDADMNKESTRLQALQVQQQLGIQALSIANGNSQSILSLFR